MRPAVNDVSDEPKRCWSLNKDNAEGQSRQEYFNWQEPVRAVTFTFGKLAAVSPLRMAMADRRLGALTIHLTDKDRNCQVLVVGGAGWPTLAPWNSRKARPSSIKQLIIPISRSQLAFVAQMRKLTGNSASDKVKRVKQFKVK